MFIETEQTPNPATLKFLPGRVVMDAGTADFASSAEAVRSPVSPLHPLQIFAPFADRHGIVRHGSLGNILR